jgi:hypothetical protein
VAANRLTGRPSLIRPSQREIFFAAVLLQIIPFAVHLGSMPRVFFFFISKQRSLVVLPSALSRTVARAQKQETHLDGNESASALSGRSASSTRASDGNRLELRPPRRRREDEGSAAPARRRRIGDPCTKTMD